MTTRFLIKITTLFLFLQAVLALSAKPNEKNENVFSLSDNDLLLNDMQGELLPLLLNNQITRTIADEAQYSSEEKGNTIQEIIANIKILSPRDLSFTGFTQEEAEKALIKLKNLVRSNIIYAVNLDVLKKIVTPRNFKIMIVDPKSIEGAIGSFDPNINQIEIAFLTYFTDETMRIALKDEFDHAAVCLMRKPRTGFNKDCVLHENFEDIEKAIIAGYKKISEYEHLLEDYLEAKKLDKTFKPSAQLNEFFNYLAPYELEHIHARRALEDHCKTLKYVPGTTAQNGVMFIPKHHIYLGRELNPRAVNIKLSYINPKEVIYDVQWYTDNNIISKAQAFFEDIRTWISRFKTDALYNNPGTLFNNRNAKKVSEKASHLAHLPPQLLHLYFDQYCQLISQDHQVKDYCTKLLPR